MTRWSMSAYSALYGDGKPPVSRRSGKRSSKVAPKCESESIAQQKLVRWMKEEGIIHYAVPNGADVTPYNRYRLIKEGLSVGMVDLVIPLARHSYFGLYMELKRADGGAGLSTEQEKWIERLNAEGYYAICCHGFDQAKERIAWYVGIDV